MAGANITMGVNGIDKTGAAFTSIKNRAKATGASIRSIMGGAIAAAGAYLSVRSIKSGIDELGNLSDLAMKAGTSVDALTKSALAFQVAGLNLPVESLARSFQYLKKRTGEGGMDNFFKVAGEIAKIQNASERGAALVKNFGRSGLELQPLIDGGEEAIAKMHTLTEIMPGVSQAAADAGDATADSLKIFGTGAHNLFLKVVGKIASMWNDDFPGGVRAGALNAINWFDWALKRMYNFSVRWGAKIGLKLQAMWNWAENGYTWEQAMEEYDRLAEMLDKEMDAEKKKIDNKREVYKSKLRELSVDDLAGAFGPRSATALAGEIGEAAAKAAHRVTNELIMGGTNASNRLAILGPNFQNEQKKQTEVLKEIAKNTAKTAEQEPADLEVVNLT